MNTHVKSNWNFKETPTKNHEKLSWNFNRIQLEIHWKSSWKGIEITMEIHWKSSWNYNEIPLEIPLDIHLKFHLIVLIVFSRVLYALIEKMGTLGQKWGPRGILSLKWDQCVGVNICPKKIWNCLPWNSGYFETVCPGQPENLQNCLSKRKVNIFWAMLKNIIDSFKNCLFYISLI